MAVFTLGKRINTMTISMSYTVGTEENGWLNRLPKLQQRMSQSFRKAELEAESDSDERVSGEEAAVDISRSPTDAAATEGIRKRNGLGRGTGRPADIPEQRRDKTLDEKDEDITHRGIEAYQEGRQIVIEDELGDVIATINEGEHGRLGQFGEDVLERVRGLNRSRSTSPSPSERATPGSNRDISPTKPSPAVVKPSNPGSPELPLVSDTSLSPDNTTQARDRPTRKRSVANAFRIDDTVILEDEDGEVIKRYRIPRARQRPDRRPASSFIPPETKNFWDKCTKFLRNGGEGSSKQSEKADLERADTDAYPMSEYDYDGVISEASDDEDGTRPKRRFRIHDSEGRNLSTREMVERLKKYDAHAREIPQGPAAVDTKKNTVKNIGTPVRPADTKSKKDPNAHRLPGGGKNPLQLQPIPGNAPLAPPTLPPTQHPEDEEETAAERKRREAALGIHHEDDAEDADNEDEERPRQPPRQSIRFAEHVRPQDKDKGKGKGKA